MTSSTLTHATDTVGDAWSTGAGAVSDLAASAAGLATDLATVAVGQFEELPGKVSGLASAARDRISPAPKRSVRPWMLLAAAVVAFVAVAWWLRRRSSDSPAVDVGFDGRENPVRSHREHAATAAD